jgi:hypothetical protein
VAYGHWGNGVFPVERHVATDGTLMRVRIVLATAETIGNTPRHLYSQPAFGLPGPFGG